MSFRKATWPSGTLVIWRPLTWTEFRFIAEGDGPVWAKYLQVYETCLQQGPRVDVVGYGIVEWIGKYELLNSPFTGNYKTIVKSLQEKRAWVTGSYLNSARALVSAIFKYRFEEIDDWDADKFMSRLAQAEFVMGRPLEPSDPDAVETVDKPGGGKGKVKGKRRT
jgi:hypothetical protein